jgi:hypothetical protein
MGSGKLVGNDRKAQAWGTIGAVPWRRNCRENPTAAVIGPVRLATGAGGEE